VIPALRCLKTAERVHVITGMRDRVERPLMPRILVEHGIQAELHVLPIGVCYRIGDIAGHIAGGGISGP
jgi:hypothetical protein